MKNRFVIFIVLLVLTINFIPAVLVAQEDLADLINEQLDPIENIYNPNDDIESKTFSVAVARIIQAVIGFLGIIFLALIVYAGFTWMTAAGNEEKISRAKKIMSAAIIGAAIVIAAYAISYFVIDQLLLATQGEGIN